MATFLPLRDRIAVALGYRKIGKLQMEPPRRVMREVSKGTFIWPKQAIYTDVLCRLNWRGRLRILLGGNIQMVNIIWVWGEDEPKIAGDHQQFEINPPKWLAP